MNLTKPHMQNSKDYWQERYEKSDAHLFSKEPSDFLMKSAELFPSQAAVADLACGEGRNAVAVALKGHKVKAFDFIQTAIDRTQELAKASKVEVETKLQDLDFFLPELMSYDVIMAIDFKPPPTLIKNMIRGLKKNGVIVIEAYLSRVSQEREDIEFFETFKEGELLSYFGGPAANYRVVHYNELSDFESKATRAQLIVKKTEML